MFKMSTVVAALFVAALMGLACSSSGLKSRAGDAGAASGGQAGSAISSGTSGGSGGTIGPGGAGAASIGGTAGMIGPGGPGGAGTGGPSGSTGGTDACIPITCPMPACTYGALPNPDPCGCSFICVPTPDAGMTNDSGGATSAGGATGTGGTSATGGALSTGGIPNTGGSSATGGASSTCGISSINTEGVCSGLQWSAVTSSNPITFSFGSGTTFPEYVALDTCSGYIRFVYSTSSAWGSSIILPPAFWTDDELYHQGAPINTQININCERLQILLTGTLAGLSFSGTLTILPPGNNQITASVSMTTGGPVTLATDHPWEAFKPVMISTMYESSTVWDADYAIIGTIIGSDTYPLPTSGWVVSSPVAATHFGVVGGSSSWKTNAPTVVIDLAGVSSPLVTGWMTQSADPNDDNGSLWAATTEVQSSWSYDITVSQ